MSRTPRAFLWLLGLFAIALPFYDYSFFNLGERGIGRLDWTIGGALVVLFAMHLATHRVKLSHSPANRYVLLFLYVGLLSIVNLFNAQTGQFLDFGTKAIQLLLVTGVFLVISNLPLEQKEMIFLIRAWIFTAFVTSLYAIYQVIARANDWPFAHLALTNPTTSYGYMTPRVYGSYIQATGFLKEPGWLASYLIGPIAFTSVIIYRRKAHVFLFNSSRLNWFLLAALTMALILSGSSGGIITIVALVVAMQVGGRLHSAAAYRVGLIALLLLVLAAFSLSSLEIPFWQYFSARTRFEIRQLANPMGAPPNTSFAKRFDRGLLALQVWASRPILGTGLNNFKYYSGGEPHALSPWLQLLAEQGIVGPIALLLIYWAVIRGLNNCMGMTDPSSFWHVVSLGLLIILVSDMINGLFALNWVHSQRWFTLALANLAYIRGFSQSSQIKVARHQHPTVSNSRRPSY